MKRRSYAIPLASAVTAALASAVTGCNIAIVGDWELKEVSDGSTTMHYPLTYTYSYGGDDYTYTMAAFLTVEKDLDATMDTEITYSYGNQSYTDSYSYDVDIDRSGRRRYEIAIDDEPMDCSIKGGTMNCNILEDEDYTIMWEKL